MYASAMAWLERKLGAPDKLKHQIVGAWLAAIFLPALVLAYVCCSIFPPPASVIEAAVRDVIVLLLTLLLVWIVAEFNEWRQQLKNDAAVRNGYPVLHEVSNADVRATVMGAVPVVLPWLCIAVFRLFL